MVDLPLAEEKKSWTFHKWKGELEQVDDIRVMGIQV